MQAEDGERLALGHYSAARQARLASGRTTARGVCWPMMRAGAVDEAGNDDAAALLGALDSFARDLLDVGPDEPGHLVARAAHAGLLDELGLHGAGADGGDAHALAAELVVRALGEAEDERLRGGVGGGEGNRLEGGGRRDVDDRPAAAIGHRRAEARLEVDERLAVERDHRGEARGIRAVDRARAAEAGVVDEDLDVEPKRLDLRQHLVAAGVGAEVGGDVLGADAVRLVELLGERLQAILAAGDEGHAVAAGGELAGDLLADARRSAGDEGGGRVCRLGKRHRGRRLSDRSILGVMSDPLNPFGDPEELQRRLAEFAEQMQGAQQVSFADNAINLAVQMTVASIQRLNLQGTSDEQAMQVRDAIRVVFPEAVTLVREAREGLS